MDFQMKLKFMRLTTEEIPFTNWMKPDFYRTFDITLKISASRTRLRALRVRLRRMSPPKASFFGAFRLRERYWLGARSLHCGNCFSRITFFNPFNRIAHTFFNPFEGDFKNSPPLFHNHPTTRVS